MKYSRKKTSGCENDPDTQSRLISVIRLADATDYLDRQIFPVKPAFMIAGIEPRRDVASLKVNSEAPGKLLFSESGVLDCVSRLLESRGYVCVFAGSFLSEEFAMKVRMLPVFNAGKISVYDLSASEYAKGVAIFEKMIEDLALPYRYKYDLQRIYITQLIHLGLRNSNA